MPRLRHWIDEKEQAVSDEVKHVGPNAVVDATALLDLVTATNGLLSTIDDLPAKQLENERAHFVVLARRAVDRVKVMPQLPMPGLSIFFGMRQRLLPLALPQALPMWRR